MAAQRMALAQDQRVQATKFLLICVLFGPFEGADLD